MAGVRSVPVIREQGRPLQPDAASAAGLREILDLFLLLGLVGLVDYGTSYEVSVLPLYFLPIGLATVRFGLWGGLWAVLCSTLAWWLADIGHAYTQEWVRWLNAFGGVLIFLTAVAAAYVLLERLRAPGRVGPGSGRVGAVADVCESCHSVRPAGGMWEDAAEFLRDEAAFEVHAKLCPTCARRRFASAAGCGRAADPASRLDTSP